MPSLKDTSCPTLSLAAHEGSSREAEVNQTWSPFRARNTTLPSPGIPQGLLDVPVELEGAHHPKGGSAAAPLLSPPMPLV